MPEHKEMIRDLLNGDFEVPEGVDKLDEWEETDFLPSINKWIQSHESLTPKQAAKLEEIHGRFNTLKF